MPDVRPVALITGGTRGIGLGIARSLAADGWDVAVNGQRPAEDVSGALAELQSLGADACYCRGDISSASGRSGVLESLRQRFGRLNLLVNNAGVAPDVRADVLEAGEESFDRLMRINVKGPYFLTQAAAKWMIEQKRANPDERCSVVTVTSISADTASTNRGDYCISKAALSMATQLWAVRLAEFGIPVYEVRPGIIKTDMTAGVQAKYDALIEGGLLLDARWGLPEDVGRAVASLARGDFAYSTGSVFMVDGGFSVNRL